MKKLKFTLSALVIAALISGLFLKWLRQDSQISRQEFLFDTLCSISVYSKADSAALSKAFDEAFRIHRLADFYDKNSDVSKINNAKAGEAVKVSPDTMNMLTLAQSIYDETDGAFNVCIAPLSQIWKLDAQSPHPPDSEQINRLLPLVNDSVITLDSQNLTVTKSHSLARLDLGAIAKGYAADTAVAALKNCGVQSSIVDFGGNIVTLGENPKTKNKKWRIGLQTPFAPTGEYSDIAETDGGFALVTSGTYQRYFEHNGKIYHHIINPKTGYPAEQPFQSVTVISKSAAVSDCLATAIFVLGEERGSTLLARYDATARFLP